MIGNLISRCRNSFERATRCSNKTSPERKQVKYPKLVLPRIPERVLHKLTPLPVVFTEEDAARADERFREFMRQHPEYNDHRLEPPPFLDDEDALYHYGEVHDLRIREAMALDDEYRQKCEPILAQLEAQETDD